MSAKQPDTIAFEWESFRATVIENNDAASREEIREWQALFYGGAKACIRLICNAEDPNAVVDAINAELDRYGRDVVKRGKL